jgi:hypothetical protein
LRYEGDKAHPSVPLKIVDKEDAIDDKGAKILFPLNFGNIPRYLRNLEENLPEFLTTILG